MPRTHPVRSSVPSGSASCGSPAVIHIEDSCCVIPPAALQSPHDGEGNTDEPLEEGIGYPRGTRTGGRHHILPSWVHVKHRAGRLDGREPPARKPLGQVGDLRPSHAPTLRARACAGRSPSTAAVSRCRASRIAGALANRVSYSAACCSLKTAEGSCCGMSPRAPEVLPQPRRAASIAAMSIFVICIIASNARLRMLQYTDIPGASGAGFGTRIRFEGGTRGAKGWPRVSRLVIPWSSRPQA